MEDQPYAPPASVALPVSASAAELPRTPVLVMILLSLLTLGLYVPYWFFSRRSRFNRLAGEGESVDGLTFTLVGAYLASFTLGFVIGAARGAGGVAPYWSDVLQIVDIGSRILTIVISFKIKLILEGSYPDQFSALGTFFFSLFYLQYKINRLGELDSVAARFTLR